MKEKSFMPWSHESSSRLRTSLFICS